MITVKNTKVYQAVKTHPPHAQPAHRSLSNYQNLLSQLVAIIVASLMDLLTDKSMSTSPYKYGGKAMPYTTHLGMV